MSAGLRYIRVPFPKFLRDLYTRRPRPLRSLATPGAPLSLPPHALQHLVVLPRVHAAACGLYLADEDGHPRLEGPHLLELLERLARREGEMSLGERERGVSAVPPGAREAARRSALDGRGDGAAHGAGRRRNTSGSSRCKVTRGRGDLGTRGQACELLRLANYYQAESDNKTCDKLNPAAQCPSGSPALHHISHTRDTRRRRRPRR